MAGAVGVSVGFLLGGSANIASDSDKDMAIFELRRAILWALAHEHVCLGSVEVFENVLEDTKEG